MATGVASSVIRLMVCKVRRTLGGMMLWNLQQGSNMAVHKVILLLTFAAARSSVRVMNTNTILPVVFMHAHTHSPPSCKIIRVAKRYTRTE